MNIIYLSKHHAKSMADMKALVRIYGARNHEGLFDEAIQKYSRYYDELMDQVLDR